MKALLRNGFVIGLIALSLGACSSSNDDYVPGTYYYAYVANNDANTVSAYVIDPSTGAWTALSGSAFPTGSQPSSIAIDPTGQFAYVANYGSNNVSG